MDIIVLYFRQATLIKTLQISEPEKFSTENFKEEVKNKAEINSPEDSTHYVIFNGWVFERKDT